MCGFPVGGRHCSTFRSVRCLRRGRPTEQTTKRPKEEEDKDDGRGGTKAKETKQDDSKQDEEAEAEKDARGRGKWTATTHKDVDAAADRTDQTVAAWTTLQTRTRAATDAVACRVHKRSAVPTQTRSR